MIPLGSNKSFSFLIRSNLTGLLYLISFSTFNNIFHWTYWFNFLLDYKNFLRQKNQSL